MKRFALAFALAVLTTVAGGALAVERTVVLKVDNMTCASCYYVVAKTLKGIPGVTDVVISSEEDTAIVTFDDAATDVAAFTAATAGVGFPSRAIE